MPIEPSGSEIFCQNCGAGWSGRIDCSMYYFELSPPLIAISTAEDLIALDYTIEKCPKCPIALLDDAMRIGADRRFP